jgi:hypothetical protein
MANYLKPTNKEKEYSKDMINKNKNMQKKTNNAKKKRIKSKRGR